MRRLIMFVCPFKAVYNAVTDAAVGSNTSIQPDGDDDDDDDELRMIVA